MVSNQCTFFYTNNVSKFKTNNNSLRDEKNIILINWAWMQQILIYRSNGLYTFGIKSCWQLFDKELFKYKHN